MTDHEFLTVLADGHDRNRAAHCTSSQSQRIAGRWRAKLIDTPTAVAEIARVSPDRRAIEERLWATKGHPLAATIVCDY